MTYGTAWFEASIPKRLNDDGTNVVLATSDAAKSETIAMINEAKTVLSIAVPPLSEVRICRLDVTQDFVTMWDIPRILFSIMTNPCSTKHPKFHHYGTVPNLETLYMGPKRAWHLCVYDKGLQSAVLGPQGLLRFEARLRRSALCRNWVRSVTGPLDFVDELHDSKVELLLRTVVSRVGLGDSLPIAFADVGSFYEIDWSLGEVDAYF